MLSRDSILALMRERVHHPAGIRELLQLLKVPREERATFKRQINALVASGELIQLRGHRVGLPEKMDLHVGRLQTHAGGYGFVIPERPIYGPTPFYTTTIRTLSSPRSAISSTPVRPARTSATCR